MSIVAFYHYHDTKPLPNELLVMYRQRSGLTQSQLAQHLGLKSDRMIQHWEGGYRLPTAERLQQMFRFYLSVNVFVRGKEQAEARQLWSSVKDMFDTNSHNYEIYPIFDEQWFEALLTAQSQPKISPTLLPSTDPQEFETALELASASQPLLHNLPGSLSSFIGREREMRQIKSLLKKNRLLTLTGTGGAGKSRLSFQIASQVLTDFKAGVWLVELAPLADPALVPNIVARRLGVEVESSNSISDLLINYLRPKHILLVLDNCEHLSLACAQLAESLLQNCPQVWILTTSREGLGLTGEVFFAVPSLKLPFPVDSSILAQSDQSLKPEFITDLSECESVRLFTERAKLIQPEFKLTTQNGLSVARICQNLEGLPLAIELAAARVQVLTVEQIASRLDGQMGERFRLLSGGSRTAPLRHQTLKAMLDWSYNLLPEAEKVLLNRLAVFAGSWTLEEAEQICSDASRPTRQASPNPLQPEIEAGAVLDLLTQLVKKSLVVVEDTFNDHRDNQDSPSKSYRLLEIIKQYAAEKIVEVDEPERLNRQHCEYYLALAEKAEAELFGPEQERWLKLLKQSYPNLHQALQWAFEDRQGQLEPERAIATPTPLEAGLRLSKALGGYWRLQGLYSQGRRWLELARAKSEIGENPNLRMSHPELIAARAKYLAWEGDMAMMQGDHRRAARVLEAGLVLSREISDKKGAAQTLVGLGMLAVSQGRYRAALELCGESLSLRREIGDSPGIVHSLINYGALLSSMHDPDAGRAVLREGLELARQQANKYGIALALFRLGAIERDVKAYDQALDFYQQGLILFRELNNGWGVPATLRRIGEVALDRGEYERAVGLFEESIARFQIQGSKWGIAEALLDLANALLQQAKYIEAAINYQKSLIIYNELGNPLGVLSCLDGLIELACRRDEPEIIVLLVGAGEIFKKEMEPAPRPIQHAYLNEMLDYARANLDEAIFERVWEQGQTRPLEQVLSLVNQTMTNNRATLQPEPKSRPLLKRWTDT